MSVRDWFLGLMVGTVVGLFGSPAALHAQSTGVREVEASARSVIALQTRLRYTTMIVLPETEEVLHGVLWVRDLWVITATQHRHVKPRKESASTNLNLVAAGARSTRFSERKTARQISRYVNADPSAPAGKPMRTAAQSNR